MKLILTCEHGGNYIPSPFQKYFQNANDVLNTHRGYDIGSLDLFNALKHLSVFHQRNTISRLLIELNRSLHHKNLFSEFSKLCLKDDKDFLIQSIYVPYRKSVELKIENLLKHHDYVLHIAVHSFTPVYSGVTRNCDIGLLYDPRRIMEKKFCKSFKQIINTKEHNLVTRLNYPYQGKTDGFPTYLRQKFSEKYLGIEFEINQKFAKNNKIDKNIKQAIYNSLQDVMK